MWRSFREKVEIDEDKLLEIKNKLIERIPVRKLKKEIVDVKVDDKEETYYKNKDRNEEIGEVEVKKGDKEKEVDDRHDDKKIRRNQIKTEIRTILTPIKMN